MSLFFAVAVLSLALLFAASMYKLRATQRNLVDDEDLYDDDNDYDDMFDPFGLHDPADLNNFYDIDVEGN